MGLRKLKEYPKPPQMRVLKSEPDKNTKFPAWMLIILMIVLASGFIFKATQNDKEETLEEFVERAKKSEPNEYMRFKISKTTPKQVEKIKELTRIDVSDYNWYIDIYSVKHIFKQHGDYKSEYLRGQQNVTTADFKKIYSIINSPDNIKYTIDQKHNLRLLIITKVISQSEYVFIVTISKKKKTLSSKTFYIKRLPR